LSTPYRSEIVASAAAHGLDPDLVQAVVEQESSGRFYAYRYEPAFFMRYLASKAEYKDRNPHEVSASYGLMQTMFSTAVEHGYDGEPWGLFAPTVSLEYGCRVLASNLKWARGHYVGLAKHEVVITTRAALAAYNGGKVGNQPNGPLRNREYADEVLMRYERIRGAVK
jgi:soluble lytic murein transglycosylase-like protein